MRILEWKEPINFYVKLTASPEPVQVGTKQQVKERKALFVKYGDKYKMIREAGIVYGESDQNYLVIRLKDRNTVTARSTITEFEESLSPNLYMKAHLSFIIAIIKVSGLQGNMLFAGSYLIPVGNIYRDEVMRVPGIRK